MSETLWSKACTPHDLTEIKCYPWLCSWLPGSDTFLRSPHFLSFGSCDLQIYIIVLIICLLRGGLSLDLCQKFRSEFASCTIAVCFKEIISIHPHRCQLDPYLSASVFMLYFKTEMIGGGGGAKSAYRSLRAAKSHDVLVVWLPWQPWHQCRLDRGTVGLFPTLTVLMCEQNLNSHWKSGWNVHFQHRM